MDKDELNRVYLLRNFLARHAAGRGAGVPYRADEADQDEQGVLRHDESVGRGDSPGRPDSRRGLGPAPYRTALSDEPRPSPLRSARYSPRRQAVPDAGIPRPRFHPPPGRTGRRPAADHRRAPMDPRRSPRGSWRPAWRTHLTAGRAGGRADDHGTGPCRHPGAGRQHPRATGNWTRLPRRSSCSTSSKSGGTAVPDAVPNPPCLLVAACGAAANAPTERVTIPPGATVRVVADSLAAHGIISSRRWFRLVARLGGYERKLADRPYEFPRGPGALASLRAIASGKAVLARLTVPEGFTLFDIAEAAERDLGIPRGEMLEAARDTALLHEVRCSRLGLRGIPSSGDLPLRAPASPPRRWCAPWRRPSGTTGIPRGAPRLRHRAWTGWPSSRWRASSRAKPRWTPIARSWRRSTATGSGSACRSRPIRRCNTPSSSRPASASPGFTRRITSSSHPTIHLPAPGPSPRTGGRPEPEEH